MVIVHIYVSLPEQRVTTKYFSETIDFPIQYGVFL